MNEIETFDQIQSFLKKYKVKDLRMLLSLFGLVISRNPDFHFCLKSESEQEEVTDIIEEECGREVPADKLLSLLTEEDAALLREFDDLPLNPKLFDKVKKAKVLEMLVHALDNDILFEGFCLAFSKETVFLERLADELGCTQKYRRLTEDPVYKKRKAFQMKLTAYTHAALNLYGVVHVSELMTIVSHYEPKMLSDTKGYARASGVYPVTLCFSPEWWSMYTVHQYTGNCIPDIGVTLDAFLVNDCFLEEVERERKQLFASLAAKKKVGIEDLEESIDSSDASFRFLYEEAMEKDFYLPDKNEFLRYADDEYYEHTNEERRFRKYIEKNFGTYFAETAKELGLTKAGLIDEFMYDLHLELSDQNEDGYIDVHESVQGVFEALESYGITMRGPDQVSEILGLLMPLMNSVRLWRNHGYTPIELRRMKPVMPENVTIVPGSTNASKMLSESREEIEKMGFRVDPEGGAKEIPGFYFPEGAGGRAEKTTRKIYPNDPCPCGSGKKYKKCCGRNK